MRAEVLLVNVQAGSSLAYNFPYDNLRLGAVGTVLRDSGLSVDYFDSFQGASQFDGKLKSLSARPTVVIDSLYRISEGVISAIATARKIRPEARVMLIGRAAAEICRDPRVADVVDAVHDSADLGAIVADCVRHAQGRCVDALVSWASTTPERPFARLSNPRGVIDVEATRGCMHACSFCAVDGVVGAPRRRMWEAREPSAIVAEISEQVVSSGIRKIQFVDDNFLGGPQSAKWAEAFAEEVRRNRLAIRFSIYARLDRVLDEAIDALVSVGLVQVHAGVESGSPSVLRRLRKGTTPQKMSRMIGRVRRANVELIASLIVFEPRMTLDELQESLVWLKANGLQRFFSLSTLIPFPASMAYGELRDRLVRRADGNFSFLSPGYMFDDEKLNAIYVNARSAERRYNAMTGGWVDKLMRARFKHEELLETSSMSQSEQLRSLDGYRLQQIDQILNDIARIRH